MSDRSLVVEVRLLDDRWHGAGEWPPSPMRLFQALVAGAWLGRGEWRGTNVVAALDWLSGLDAPVIAAPASTLGERVNLWVPNNDLDAMGGDPAKIEKIKTGKAVHPRLVGDGALFRYVWRIDGDSPFAATLVAQFDRLYQLGRGVDMAYAHAELVSFGEAEARLRARGDPVWRPVAARIDGGLSLRCPCAGTLASLQERHAKQADRLKQGVLRQAPPPLFRLVAYDCPPQRLLFELCPASGRERFRPWPLVRAAELVTALRDRAVRRLTQALPEATRAIERTLIGRGATEADKALRVRIIPLPSIGGPNVDSAIRRVLVERPADCLIRSDDLAWALSGLDLGVDYDTGEIVRGDLPVLLPSEDRQMLRHYGVETETAALVWRTVTPAALPVWRDGGRLSGADRLAKEGEAARAVRQALRHAGIVAPPVAIRVQREPFLGAGARAEDFAAGSRFQAARLWHLEVAFAAPAAGPLMIGDGRYSGLGLMAPHIDADSPRSFRYAVSAPTPVRLEAALPFTERARTALLGLAASLLGEECIPPALSGHQAEGDPLRRGRPQHLFVLPEDADEDGLIDHLLLSLPADVGRREATQVAAVALRFQEIRVGGAPKIQLRLGNDGASAVCGQAASWVSLTPYLHPWHAKKRFGVEDQIRRECRIRGLPEPVAIDRMETIEAMGRMLRPMDFQRSRGGRGGPQPDRQGGFFRLSFARPVAGPIALGWGAHFGLGLFRRAG